MDRGCGAIARGVWHGLSCGVLRTDPVRIAVFASGNGSNFEALAAAFASDPSDGRIVAVLCDRPEAPVIERARRHGIETITPPVGRFRSRIEDEAPWLAALRSHRVELVVLAGFMRRVHATLLEPFAGRMLNLHPSLLPSFPGLDAIGQAWRHGVGVTGCTVHLVEDAIDAGPIVAQSPVTIAPGETLASLEARVHEAEHALLPLAVRRFIREPWHLEGRRLVFGSGPGFVRPSEEVAHG